MIEIIHCSAGHLSDVNDVILPIQQLEFDDARQNLPSG
jgi:hypothetical protein